MDNIFYIFRNTQKRTAYLAANLIPGILSSNGGDHSAMDFAMKLTDRGAFGGFESYGLFVVARFISTNGIPKDDKTIDALIWFMDHVKEQLGEMTQVNEEQPFFRMLLGLKEDISFDPDYYEKLAEPITSWLLKELPEVWQTLKEIKPDLCEWQDLEYLACMSLLKEINAFLYKAPKAEPSRLYAYLDKYVIGQESAKKILSTAVYGHLKRIKYKREKFLPDAVLLVGPSGCGKTELVKHLVEATELPVVIKDVSGMNGSQYTGGLHREDLLTDLLNSAGGNLEKAESGIVFMDEFDKVLIPAYDSQGVNIHEEVQSQLLTVIEGSEIEVIYKNERMMFDTSRLLFILAGAFQGIEEHIRSSSFKALNTGGTIGFDARLEKDNPEKLVKENVTTEVLLSYGMKRELAGRIGSIAVLDGLKREDFLRILSEPKDSMLSKLKEEFKALCGGEIRLSDGVKDKIVDMAQSYGVGARGLSIALRKLLMPVLYEAPEHKGVSVVQVSLDNEKIHADWTDSFAEEAN